VIRTPIIGGAALLRDWPNGRAVRRRFERVPAFSDVATRRRCNAYFRCPLTSFVISNIETCFFPPKIGFSFASELIIRLFFWS